jgi:hypothetical protein
MALDKFVRILKKIDRRWIYLLILFSCLIPFWIKGMFDQEFSISKETQRVYDIIDGLKEGEAVFIDWAFDPTLQAELLPMVEQLIKQCLDKKLRIFIYYPYVTGISLGENLIVDIKKEEKYKKIENGIEYIQLGYLPIDVDMMLFSSYSDFKSTFGKEGRIFKGIKTMDDISYIISFSGSDHTESYIILQKRFGFKLGVGVTAVIGPDFVPYLQTGQLDGMLFGLRGAAEYEKLRVKNGAGKTYNQKAGDGLAALTLSQLVMFLFIGLGNFIYFYERKHKKKI